MPQKSAPELFALVHYLHRLSTEGKRGAKMALESCPKCHFIMLEGVLMKTLVRPTEKGLDASRQVEAAISRYFERVICRIPEEQREQLFSLTGVLLEAVEAENAEQQANLKGENENG